MPVDPCFAAWLADPRNEVRPPPAHVPMEKVRRAANAVLNAVPRLDIHAVAALSANNEGRAIPLRLYRPSGASSLPAIVFCHGGGWVWGDLETHDALCRELALRSGCAIVAVDYRLAPETPFPGPVEDGLAALRWTRRNAVALGLDGDRLALCGDSAGANLAIAIASKARADGPMLRYLALMYPAIDPGCSSASQEAFSRGYMLTQQAMRWMWRCYLGETVVRDNPLVAPLNADLTGLPPTSVATAECDILRDEGEAFAARLEQAGVGVRKRRYAGMIHGFASLPHMTPAASKAIADIAGDLRAALTA
jgi:acetyl esterase